MHRVVAGIVVGFVVFGKMVALSTVVRQSLRCALNVDPKLRVCVLHDMSVLHGFALVEREHVFSAFRAAHQSISSISKFHAFLLLCAVAGAGQKFYAPLQFDDLFRQCLEEQVNRRISYSSFSVLKCITKTNFRSPLVRALTRLCANKLVEGFGGSGVEHRKENALAYSAYCWAVGVNELAVRRETRPVFYDDVAVCLLDCGVEALLRPSTRPLYLLSLLCACSTVSLRARVMDFAEKEMPSMPVSGHLLSVFRHSAFFLRLLDDSETLFRLCCLFNGLLERCLHSELRIPISRFVESLNTAIPNGDKSFSHTFARAVPQAEHLLERVLQEHQANKRCPTAREAYTFMRTAVLLHHCLADSRTLAYVLSYFHSTRGLSTSLYTLRLLNSCFKWIPHLRLGDVHALLESGCQILQHVPVVDSSQPHDDWERTLLWLAESNNALHVQHSGFTHSLLAATARSQLKSVRLLVIVLRQNARLKSSGNRNDSLDDVERQLVNSLTDNGNAQDALRIVSLCSSLEYLPERLCRSCVSTLLRSSQQTTSNFIFLARNCFSVFNALNNAPDTLSCLRVAVTKFVEGCLLLCSKESISASQLGSMLSCLLEQPALAGAAHLIVQQLCHCNAALSSSETELLVSKCESYVSRKKPVTVAVSKDDTNALAASLAEWLVSLAASATPQLACRIVACLFSLDGGSAYISTAFAKSFGEKRSLLVTGAEELSAFCRVFDCLTFQQQGIVLAALDEYTQSPAMQQITPREGVLLLHAMQRLHV